MLVFYIKCLKFAKFENSDSDVLITKCFLKWYLLGLSHYKL